MKKKDSPAGFYVEKESLAVRKLDPENLIEGLEPVEHRKVSELLAANHLQLIF